MLEILAVLAGLAMPVGPSFSHLDSGSAEPPVVRVVSREYGFDAPDRIPAGAVTFELLNEGAEPHHAWIVRLEDGHDLTEYMEAVHEGRGATPPWAVDMGGPMVMMEPGAISNATIELAPGRYALVCHVPSPDGIPHLAKGMAKEFIVEEPAGPTAAMPEADVTINLVDYAFVIEKPLHPGRQRVLFTNTSAQTHELVLWRLDEGAHVDDLIAWVFNMDGPPPAILFYNRLLELWRAPDSDLVPVRDSIEARRNALVRATG